MTMRRKYYYSALNESLIKVCKGLLAFVLTFVIITAILGVSGYIETHYDTTAVVLSNENNEVILVDGAGYVWGVTNRPDLHKNDFVKIKFFNNCTDYTREDDEILNVKVLDE